jgi:hypothetical protein
MSTQAHPTMFNPFDGILLATGTAISTTFALAVGDSPVLTAIAGASVTGVFLVAAKAVELWWKARTDTRVRELEQQLRDIKTLSIDKPR